MTSQTLIQIIFETVYPHWMPHMHPRLSITPCHNWTGKKKIDVKAYEFRQGEITHQLLLQAKQTWLGDISQNQSRILRSETNIKNTFPEPVPPSQHPSPPPQWYREMGKWWSVHHMLLWLLLRERSSCPTPSWDHSHRPQLFHELLQCESHSKGYSPSKKTCSSVGLQQGHKSHQETFSSMGSSFYRSSGPFQEPATAWVSHKFTVLFWASTCSVTGVHNRLRVDLCISVIFHGLQEHRCFSMVCTMGCRESPLWHPGYLLPLL